MKKALILGIVLVFILACVGTVAANLVSNGGFENPAADPWITTMSGNELPGWTIDTGDIQLITASYWQPHGGVQSIDLAGTTPGTISQTISTVPGETYTLTFWLAGNPDGNLKDPDYVYKEVRVMWDGAALSPTATFDSTGKTRDNMDWTLVTFSGLEATEPATEIAFVTILPEGPYGAALDDISVVPESIPAPEFPGTAVPVGLIIGFAGLILVVRNSREN